MDQDSVGGKVECAIIGLKPGLGEPFLIQLRVIYQVCYFQFQQLNQ